MAETLDASFLTQRMGPLPVWGWGLLGVGGALLVSRFRSAKTTQTSGNVPPAPPGIPTTRTGTTGATGVPDFISQTYITNTPAGVSVPPVANPSPATPSGPQTINVGHNQTVGELVRQLREKGYPNYTWADFWNNNPGIVDKYGLAHATNNDWVFTQWSTPVTILAPNTLEGLNVSGDNPNPPALG